MKSIWNKLIRRTDRSNITARKTHSIKQLLRLMLPHRRKVVISALCALLVNGAQLVKPYILKVVIDDFLIGHTPQKGLYSITWMGILYFLVVTLGGALSFAQVNLINRAGQEIMKTLRNSVFKTIQLLPLSYLDKMSSGRLITRATNDVEALSEMYTDIIINLFKDVFFLIGIVYAMLALNFKLALIAFAIVPVMFFLVFLLKTKIKNNFFNMKVLIGRLNGFMAENISGMKIIQILGGEKEKKKEFLELNDAYFQTTLFQVRLNSFLRPAADIFQNLAISLLIWYGMGRIANHTLEIGVLYAFTTYIKQFFAPISNLADSYTTIQSALVSADRIFELLDQQDILEDLDEGVELGHIAGDIEFKNVWFAYTDNNWVLKDISFKLERGEMAAFVGETGAGKTTIINLISGFYTVQRGQILIDGIDINKIRKRDLRRNISAVLQDVFLFSGDIKSNITLNDRIPDHIIQEALEASCALRFVQSLPNGLHEPVMERGSTLSAGQKQLLAFARTIAHEPSIFILDEATANIDTQTERLVQKAIENITKGRTTLVIAHRLSTIRNADIIFVMKDGGIVEKGRHEDLLHLDGYYKNMVYGNEYDAYTQAT
jgi:ATP-binding cassette subfamily B multidrug efflux pump